jgi:hypothetical protein
MKGIVEVTKILKLKNLTKRDRCGNYMVTFYARNELTHFKIIFTDKNKSNLERLDYIFAIKYKIGNLIAPNIPIHSR